MIPGTTGTDSGGNGGSSVVTGVGGDGTGVGGSGTGQGGNGTTGAGGTTGSGGATTGSGGATGSGGSTGSGGATGAGGATGTGGTGPITGGASVLQHHADAARDGVYVDARLTRAAAATMHVDATFANATVTGALYAQPLYLAGTGGGSDMVIAATQRNLVYAFNAATGAQLWNHNVGTPVSTGLPCGNIATNGNTLGIMGTPVIDGATRTIYLSAMTADAAATAKHMIHALDAATGNERTGWPVDVNATASSAGTTFSSIVQNQRAALALVGGRVFVPYGGHVGDCAGYHGWIVGVSTTNPAQVTAWATRGFAGGIWGASGIASDGTSLYVATGNTKATAASGAFGSSPANWSDGETIFRFPTTLVPTAITASTEFFFPANWATLDSNDQDIGGTGPVLITVRGANPANLIMALGKDGKAYLLNRASLGGMDAAPLASLTIGGTIIQSSVAYSTTTASYVVYRGQASGCPAGQTGGFSAIRISAASPPALSIAWCGGPTAGSSPAVSMTDTIGTNTIVWMVGSDNKLHGVDGDTGQSVFAGGADTLPAVQAIQTPIIANGRIFVASSTRVSAYTP